MMEKTKRNRPPMSKGIQVAVFRRDGWLCRWCKKPVIFAPVMKFIEREIREAGYTGNLAYFQAHWSRKEAPLLDELGAVVDHVEAFSTGGSPEIENLATACNKCNSQKSSASSSKWDERRPRKFVKGKYGEPAYWDGLSNLFIMLASKDLANLSSVENEWLKALTDNPASESELSTSA
jgi:5-methylcytosine-specific restriction endonuclease McrA